jgi:hypothetical protein
VSRPRKQALSTALPTSELIPHASTMTCARCGAKDCAIVPNVDPTFTKLQGVGLTQHAMLCSNQCQGPWWCGLCNNFFEPEFFEHKEHSSWCNVAHPEVRAKWEEGRDFGTMKLAFMLASRGHFLPAFIMDGLFPGFEHADPQSFVEFKKAASR